MKAIAAIEEFKKLIFGPQDPPNWWEKLKGEVRQKRPDGRYLERTLDVHLGRVLDNIATNPYRPQSGRAQYFFSRAGNIDGRYDGLGVEEKCTVLSRDKLLDGILC